MPPGLFFSPDAVCCSFDVDYKGEHFSFLLKGDSRGIHMLIQEMPTCKCKDRILTDDRLNRINIGIDQYEIWIAKNKMPRTLEEAKEKARDWVRKIVKYFKTGKRFWLPRDDDY
jgi:hypothetical protein